MVDPSEEVCATFATLKEVAAWAGVSGDPADAKSPLGALLHALGATVELHPRIIAAMPEADYAMIMEEFLIDGVKPTPVQRTTAALLGSACRVMWGTQRRLADIRSRRIKMQSRHMSWSWQRHLYHQ